MISAFCQKAAALEVAAFISDGYTLVCQNDLICILKHANGNRISVQLGTDGVRIRKNGKIKKIIFADEVL